MDERVIQIQTNLEYLMNLYNTSDQTNKTNLDPIIRDYAQEHLDLTGIKYELKVR